MGIVESYTYREINRHEPTRIDGVEIIPLLDAVSEATEPSLVVTDLQNRVTALEVQQGYLSDTDPAANPANIITAGKTLWFHEAIGVIKLRNIENTGWISFGGSAPVVAVDVLLAENDEELLIDIEEITEHGKVSELDSAGVIQFTDLFAIVQVEDAIGRKITLANLLNDTILAFTDVTTNDVTTSAHGFCPKLPNDPDVYLRGDGTWAAIV